MNVITTLAAALTLAATAASAQSTTFNLTCSGTTRTLAPSVLLDKTEPYSAVYRIDLDAMKWCSDACQTTWAVAEATPVAITLESKNVDTPREHETLRNTISRVSGEHNIAAESGIGSRRMALFWKGQCERGEFTGFPTPVTKF